MSAKKAPRPLPQAPKKVVVKSKPDLPTHWPEGTPQNHAGYSAIIESLFSVEDARVVEVAYNQGKYAHRGQLRADGSRYFNHPRHVSIIALVECGVVDAEVVVEGLLHDTGEDAHILSPATIEQLWGVTVRKGHRLLTKEPKEGYFVRLVQFGDWKALLTKCCDRTHNMRTLGSMPLHKQREQVRETRREFPALLDALEARLPDEHKHVADYLRQQIFDACDYWSSK